MTKKSFYEETGSDLAECGAWGFAPPYTAEVTHHMYGAYNPYYFINEDGDREYNHD